MSQKMWRRLLRLLCYITVAWVLVCAGPAIGAGDSLRERAERGDGTAQFELSVQLLSAGKTDEARVWLNAAAKNGHPKAKAILAAVQPEQLERTERAVAAALPPVLRERSPSEHSSLAQSRALRSSDTSQRAATPLVQAAATEITSADSTPFPALATANPLSTPATRRMNTGPGQGQPHLVTRLNKFDEVMAALSRACNDSRGAERSMFASVSNELASTETRMLSDSIPSFILLGYAKIGDYCVVRDRLALCNPLPMEDAKKRCDCTAGLVGRTRFGPGLPPIFAKANDYIGWAACDAARDQETDPREHARYELQMSRSANFLQNDFRLRVNQKSRSFFPSEVRAAEGWMEINELWSGMSTVVPPMTKERFYGQANRIFAIAKDLQSLDLAEALTLQAQAGAMMRMGERTAAITRTGTKILFPPPQPRAEQQILIMRSQYSIQSQNDPPPAPIQPIDPFYGDRHR